PHRRLPHHDDAVHHGGPRPEPPPRHADLALQAVALDGCSHRTRKHQGKPSLPRSTSLPHVGPAFTLTHVHHQPSGSPATALAQHTPELPGGGQPVPGLTALSLASAYAERRARPLCRRRAITARPARVRIRIRNPC